MNIAQVVVVAILAASLVTPLMRHGETHFEQYSFPKQVFRVLVWIGLLKIGGFF